MRSNYLKAIVRGTALVGTVLLLMAGVSSGQSVVNLTAAQQTTILSDGNSVPMWGWTCSDYLVPAVATTGGATCTALTYNTATSAHNAQTGVTVWQPPLIVVPYTSAAGVSTTNLTINLTNTLPVETSIIILGQAGGGLGATTFGSGPGATAGPVRETGPRTDGAHAGQSATTWTTVTPNTFTPPTQSARARSFVPEVAGVAAVGGAATVGTYTWTGLKPGTYLIRTATYPSIQGPMGLYGVLVVTQAPGTVAGATYGIAYPAASATTGAVTYDADVVALESEIDARQNKMVAALFPTACTGAGTPVAGCTAAGAALPAGTPTANAGFSETAKWNPECGAGANGLTSKGTLPTCYPPAVDYTPLYFLFNGVAFSKGNQQASVLSVPAAGATGNVLVRFVNAGSHMHIPSVNNLNALLVAEDAYVNADIALALAANKTLSAKPSSPTTCTATTSPACGLKLQTEVFQPAGKVYDVIVSPTQSATAGTYSAGTYVIYDRALEALTTDNARDGGMQAILDVADAGAAAVAAASAHYAAAANPDTYSYAPGVRLTVSDMGRGVIANDLNVYGVQLSTTASGGALYASGSSVAGTQGTLTLYANGTFTYLPGATSAGTDTFNYCANGTNTVCTTITFSQSSTVGNRPVANPDSYASKSATLLRVGAPGVLVNDVDPNHYPLCAASAAAASGPTLCPPAVQTVTGTNGATISLSADGSFTARLATPPAKGATTTSTFTYVAANSQGTASNPATVTLTFQGGSGLQVTVQDAQSKAAITDYKWIIEQDLSIHIDPACQVNTGTGARPIGSNGLPCPAGLPQTPATQFHTSYMPVIAEGCTGPQSCERGQTVYDAGTPCISANNPVGCSPTAGQHVAAACDGYGICTVGATQLPASLPSDANLSATNPDGTPASYYISILSGDSQNAFSNGGNTKDPTVPGNCTPTGEPTGMTTASACGHTMGGAPIPAGTCTGTAGTATFSCTFAPVTVNLQLNPLKTATVTAFVFEDDFPLNGEPDTGGGVDSLATLEVPLGDFQIEIWDAAGGVGDFTGQMTYDMFNMPLTNALNGTIDPNTGLDACPISNTSGVAVGVILTCPQYESDGKTPSPLTGQVVVRNLMQGKFSLIAHPGAARVAAGEEWLQTNTLDGGHFLDSFIKVGEPSYFQEFGPGGYHVFFGFANPKHINARLAAICAGTLSPTIPFAAPCRNNLNGQVTNLHQSRSPNEQLYSGSVFAQGNAGNYAPLAYTNCYAAIGDTDGATIALSKCDPDGNFKFTNLPDGNYGLVIFDQWNDMIVDGSSHAVNLKGGQTLNVVYPSFSWQAHLWSRLYMDTQGKGAPNLLPDGTLDPATSPGLIQVPTRVRQPNGKFVNTLLSDIGGNMRFDETFPLFAWYTVESDNTRFRGTGVHVVNDAGGQVDGPQSGCASGPICGNGVTTSAYQGVLNSKESFSLPPNLRVPGAVYCANGDPQCAHTNFSTNPTGNGSSAGSCTAGTGGTQNCTGLSTGRVDPGSVDVEGWQGGVSQFDMVDWGKMPYYPGETGGIRGHVVNSTTRPFDDPRMLFQNLWEPLVPNVTVNLYQEGFAADGVTPTLTLVDTTQTSSWDAWAQGFRADGVTPNISCTGQDSTDPFFSYTMAGTRNYLTPNTPLPYNSQFKCFDGYHNLNQIQPATYDGLFHFPSQACLTGTTFTVPVAGSTTGQTYNCATVANPAFGVAGQTGAPAKILPPGKYVTEVILPSGWQLNKEEDLNLLIGDQYIAPVTQQFAGLSAIFIVPDQASIDSWNPSYTGPYTSASGVNGTSGPYNQPWSCPTPSTCTLAPSTTNNGKPSTDLGRSTFGSFGPGALIEQSAPCVGLMRIVPDYLSISPESGEIAPFAGSLRPLCDRKEVTLENQMQADVDFFIYTHTPKTTTFTGFISDDFSSEFDPASPAFGEKFAVPNVPVSIRDFNGNEVSRIYSDQWGTFNGLVYSTWEVDPPNITGYSPNMMVTCMNDPGPIPDPAHPGQFINDPYYNPGYSTFCYENPFMPGDTTYLDTPVIPISAFAEGYNPPDCNYPDGTPMIKSVLGDTIPGGTGRGPWVSAAGHTITINALTASTGPGIQVPNNTYSGPGANTAPYNQKYVTRHYGFGTAAGHVTIGGQNASCTWGDTVITCSVPGGLPQCSVLQTNPATGTKIPAQCGELVITTGGASPKQSIDAVTVTIQGTTSVNGHNVVTYVAGENSTNNAIQKAIDNADSGDLIIVGCPTGQTSCTYNELVLMWKPVRLQGIGDGAVTVNANTHPAGKLLEPWRRQVNCLFGLALNGGFISQANPYDQPTDTANNGAPFTCSSLMQGQVDPLPGEPIVGWDATLNGNIAELLQEPTLMGAYEGAAITVLGKGLENNNTTNCNPETAAGCIPLNNSTAVGGDCNRASQFYGGNFKCNPSRVDGFTFTNSSQGGGGIFLHAWNHNTEVANNHVSGNGGTLTGGITIGQMETLDATFTNGLPQAFGYNQFVTVHNNNVSFNAAYGDELNSNTPASAGGVTFCTGADNYEFNHNWVCGNWSSGDGGGMSHHGFTFNGTIENNWFLFNQSINPSLVTYGGGLVALGASPDGALGEAGLPGDIDVAPALSDGIGPGLKITGNVFQGNTAEEGSGGGLALLHVNGNDVANNPSTPENWFGVLVQNNIFANNVAGWAGGGVALLDAVKVTFNNNTVASNDSTSSAGVEFNSNGAPLGNVPPPAPPGATGPPCNPSAGATATNPNPGCPGFSFTTSVPLPAGFVTEHHSSTLSAAFTNANVTCAPFDTVPPTHACTKFSVPVMDSDIFWQNRSFHITTATSPTASVQLNPALSQTTTGSCPSGASYWDIGVYSDTGPDNHNSGITLHPTGSILSIGSYNGNRSTNPGFAHQYCNGSRVPPEIASLLCSGATGFANAPGCIQPGTVGVSMTVPGGVPDSLVPPLPAFTISPAATIDEGSNWINMFYGPLTSVCQITTGCGTAAFNSPLGNYTSTSGIGAHISSNSRHQN